MSQASKFKSNHFNSNELPEKDLKLSSSSSSNNNSRSNSSSRGGSSTSINKIKPEAIIDAYNTVNQRKQYNTNNNNNNNNLIMSRNFSSQMDIPLCNSTSIGTASSILAANNRNLLQPTYLNYPQNANLAYANYPLVNPNAATAQHIDRLLINRLSGLNMQSPNTIYSTPNQNNYMMGMHTLESTNTLAYQPSCVSNTDPHELFRRDTEIERLKMRILMLEQRETTNQIAHNSNNNSNENKLSNLEYEAALIRMEMNNNSASVEQLKKLDSLVNQKEYELEEAKKEIRNTTEKFEKELTKLTSLLNMKEEDQFKEKNKSINMQKEIEKLQTKLNDCNEYIGSLPTSEEFKEKENQVEQLKTDFASLQAKLIEKEKQNKRAKEYIRDKMNEVKQFQEKLDAANMETERIRIQFETYREETKEVGDLLDVREEKSRIVAENEVNKKCIIALHENQKNLTSKYENQLNEYKDKLKHELDTIKAFEKKLENKETEISKMENSVKKVANENQILMEENLNLKDKLSTLDTAMSADTLKFLYKLFEELNGCTLELNNLVKNCIDLHKGKQVEIDSLLGCVKSYRTYETDIKENGVLSLVNANYILAKTKEIKDCRISIAEIRNKVSNAYADSIGSNVSCIQQ